MDDRNVPATKGDLDELRTATKSDLADVKSDLAEKIEQLRSEMSHQYNDLVERIHDGQTQLLKTFYDFAQSNQKRVTTLETSDAAMVSRVASIEDRLLAVEKRLNWPPAA